MDAEEFDGKAMETSCEFQPLYLISEWKEAETLAKRLTVAIALSS